MENKQILIQKKQELAALETKMQQLPKVGSGSSIGKVLTLFGILLMVIGLPAESIGFLIGGFLFVVVGVIWWIFASTSKSTRKKALDDINNMILKIKNEIIEIEHN